MKATREALADGTMDVVVGTHAILSKNTTFKRLGLVIVGYRKDGSPVYLIDAETGHNTRILSFAKLADVIEKATLLIALDTMTKEELVAIARRAARRR